MLLFSKKNVIGIDCTSFIKGKSGGFESFLLNLLNGFHEYSDLKFVLFIRKDQYQNFLHFYKFEFYQININTTISRIFWENFILPFICITYRAVIFPADFRPLFLFTKSITIFNDFQYLYHPKYWDFGRILYRKIFTPISLRFSTIRVAISTTVKNEILDNFDIRDVEVIYIPIVVNDSSNEVLSINKEICYFKNHKYFLIPSSLALHKNLENLVYSINKLPIRFNNFKFVFTGPYLSDEFKYPIDNDNIFVLGYVENNELNYLYKYSQGVIIPSIYEGFGMPYVESIYFNKNILTCRLPITQEFFGESFSFIEYPFSSNEIYPALIKFLSLKNSSYNKITYSNIKRNTNQKYIISKYENIIKSL